MGSSQQDGTPQEAPFPSAPPHGFPTQVSATTDTWEGLEGQARPWEPGENQNLLTPTQACSGTSFSGEGCSGFFMFPTVCKPHKKLTNHTPSSLQEVPGPTEDSNLRKRTKVVGIPRP